MGILISSQELSNHKSTTAERGKKSMNWITFTIKTSGIKKKKRHHEKIQAGKMFLKEFIKCYYPKYIKSSWKTFKP